MDYGPNYSIYQLVRAIQLYLDIIKKVDVRFFNKDHLPYNMRELLCTIQAGNNLPGNRVPLTAHPAIHRAIEEQEFYKKKMEDEQNKDRIFMCSIVYNSHIIWLVDSTINLIYNSFILAIEDFINENGSDYVKSIKKLTKERQNDQYKNTHPSKFVQSYKEYLSKRIKDLKELMELDKLDVNSELKEILESYKLGLEINIKGRNLIKPLIDRNYDLFVENLKNTLYIPSYNDIYQDEKERFYHVYLLGVLEGRLNFYKLKSNKESGHGRYDICAIPLMKKNPGLIIEVKSNDKISDEDAIGQVIDNRYYTELKNDGVKEVLIVSFNFIKRDFKVAYNIFDIDKK